MLLPQVRTACTTSCGNRRCAVVRCFFWFRRLLWSGSSRPGRAWLAYRICREVSLQKRSVSMMGIESMIFNSMSSTSPISKMARLDSLLNTISSFAGSSRIQISFEPIFTRPISWVFPSLFENASVMTSFSLRWVPTSASQVARTNFLDACSTSVACFVSSRTPALLFPRSPSSRCYLRLPWERVGCCCCVCQKLFNVILDAGLGVASLSKIITRSPFWEVTRSMQSSGTVALVMIAMIDPTPWIIYPRYCILIAFPISFIMYLLKEQCNHNEVLLHRGRFRKDSEVWRRLLVEPCHSLFLSELFHSPKWIENSTKFLCERCTPSICTE